MTSDDRQDQDFECKLTENFYKESDSKLLQQGDILLTESINNIITTEKKDELEDKDRDFAEQVYPYFFKNYQFCIVLNATCDLVIGGGRQKKVDCIQLVAVDTLANTMNKALQDFGVKFGIINQKNHSKLGDFFRQVVDGQHKNRFYLPPLPPSLGLAPGLSLVARLDVIVSIRYSCENAFLDSRIGWKLESQRASKLAENTANLFARIALDDAKDILGKKDHKKWIDSELKKYCAVLPPAQFIAVTKEIESIKKDLTEENIKEILVKHKEEWKTPNIDKLLEFIEGHFKDLDGFQAKFEVIKSDPKFRSFLNKALQPQSS
ncbi:MAG: hypothetical protein ACOH5I_26400 [Oligoflexus sp.]